eukprot:CAMPEP_0194213168 /NCGR_PEP_ID=MMETSP0156-20130528/13555_1 /TAXON_ID=33649 /ORGANISM="Thalassionema nitzschioides, Strain L26-B" /LENGTH=267 /DNA_ID=CAMNT_0038941139 /DNA_START=73 /DNA_END=876 /DNA_ORIENTATION=-
MTLFVFVGCGSAVSSQIFEQRSVTDPAQVDISFDTLGVSLAFGLGISVLAYTIAPISGGHINPAVTFAFILLRKMPVVDGLMYLVVQFAGAILGAAILWGCTNAYSDGGTPFDLGANSVINISLESGFLVEGVGTFILVWTVMMTAVHKKSIAGNVAPIAIGWSVFLAHIVLIPLTGCGINPARSAGPHIINAIDGSPAPRGWWTFYTAPFVGSLLAALVASVLMGLNEDEKEDKAEVDEEDESKAKEDIIPRPGADDLGEQSIYSC